MKKVLFIIGSLQIGGAETVMVDIVNNIYRDFDITVLLVEKRGELLKTINPNIKIKYLTKSQEFCNNLISKIYNKIKLSLIYRFFSKKAWYIKRIYNKVLKETYDAEIAFLAGIPGDIVFQSPNKKSKKIAWIHSCVDKYNKKSYAKYLTFTRNFDIIVAVSQGSMDVFKETFSQIEGNVILIHNFVDTNKIINKANLEFTNVFLEEKIKCLSLGRLSQEKGFDRIINVSKKYENKINFYIGGIGPLKETLDDKIKQLDIHNVFLLGLLKNPYPYIKNCDVFLLSSRSEAYPTVVIEAMILNKFIIATEVAGVKEILKDYPNKTIISNNDDSLADGIEKYLKVRKSCDSINNNFAEINKNNLQKVKDLLK